MGKEKQLRIMREDQETRDMLVHQLGQFFDKLDGEGFFLEEDADVLEALRKQLYVLSKRAEAHAEMLYELEDECEAEQRQVG